MKKQEFINIYIKPFLTKKDKAFNRVLWNNQIDFLIKNEVLKERAGSWVKEPKKYFGED